MLRIKEGGTAWTERSGPRSSKREGNRLIQVQVTAIWVALERMGKTGGSSPGGRTGVCTYSCMHAYFAMWKNGLVPSTCFSWPWFQPLKSVGNFPPGSGRQGEDPKAMLLSGRCSLPALTRCRNLAVAGLMGREMPRGVLNASVSMLSRLYHWRVMSKTLCIGLVLLWEDRRWQGQLWWAGHSALGACCNLLFA